MDETQLVDKRHVPSDQENEGPPVKKARLSGNEPLNLVDVNQVQDVPVPMKDSVDDTMREPEENKSLYDGKQLNAPTCTLAICDQPCRNLKVTTSSKLHQSDGGNDAKAAYLDESPLPSIKRPLKDLPYCTQKCLLGLKQGSDLDLNCPNIELHRRSLTDERHLICLDCLRIDLVTQLDTSHDSTCTPLSLGGPPGRLKEGDKHMIFRTTLLKQGYVFIAKATTQDLRYKLDHEAKIYEKLSDYQGDYIPVCLGNISLSASRTWCPFGPEISHMMLLSYAGKGISEIEDERYTANFLAFQGRHLRDKGVYLKEMNRRNFLWSAELRHLMFVDFERANFKDPSEIRTILRQKEKENRQHARAAAEKLRRKVLSEEDHRRWRKEKERLRHAGSSWKLGLGRPQGEDPEHLLQPQEVINSLKALLIRLVEQKSFLCDSWHVKIMRRILGTVKCEFAQAEMD